MATLTGTQVRYTYDSLLKLNDNDGLNSGLKVVTDGLGTPSPLSLSELEVVSSVEVEAQGFKTPTGTSAQVLLADGTVTTLAGSGDLSYIHVQSVASSTWAISHGMGKFPSITVVDSGNSVVVGSTSMTDNNNLTITFTASFSGKAYLN